MNDKNMIILFGGTFNPPTNAHLKIILEIQKQFSNAKIIIIPVNDFYQKNHKIPSFHRFNMCKLLFGNKLNIEISDYEIKNTKHSYTLDTLNYFQSIYPDQDIYWLMGSDNLNDIINWYHPEDILNKYNLLVTQRNIKENISQIINKYDLLKKYKKSIYQIIIEYNLYEKDCSSTLVRNKIANNNIEDIFKYIKKEILYYIEKNNLYKD